MVWFESGKLPLLKKLPKEQFLFIDIFTSGYKPGVSSILQVAAINGAGQVLMNSYVRPTRQLNWEKLTEKTGIAADKFQSAPTFDQIRDQLQELINHAGIIGGQNVSRNLLMLKGNGITPNPASKIFDVADEFKHYQGLSRGAGLADCAQHYGYRLRSYDAYYGAGIAMTCFNKMMEDEAFLQGIPAAEALEQFAEMETFEAPVQQPTPSTYQQPVQPAYQQPVQQVQYQEPVRQKVKKQRRGFSMPSGGDSSTKSMLYRGLYLILAALFFFLGRRIPYMLMDPTLGYVVGFAFVMAFVHCLIRVIIPRGFHWIPWVLLAIVGVIELEQYRGFPSVTVNILNGFFNGFLNQEFNPIDLIGAAVGFVINLLLQRIDRDVYESREYDDM